MALNLRSLSPTKELTSDGATRGAVRCAACSQPSWSAVRGDEANSLTTMMMMMMMMDRARNRVVLAAVDQMFDRRVRKRRKKKIEGLFFGKLVNREEPSHASLAFTPVARGERRCRVSLVSRSGVARLPEIRREEGRLVFF